MTGIAFIWWRDFDCA